MLVRLLYSIWTKVEKEDKRKEALQKCSEILGIDSEEMIELMKNQLLKSKKVRTISDGSLLIREEEL